MKHNAITLTILPILFTALTALLLYISVFPIVRPYLDFASLFISSSDRVQVARNRNLFEETARQKAENAQNGTDTPALNTSTEPTVETIPISSIIRPNPGDLYGKLTIDDTNIDAPIYWGDEPTQLNAGVGTYTGAWLPGFGHTIMMAGHRNTWFRDLGSAKIGGIITVETHYETYTYRITEIAIYHMNDSSSYDFTREDENIIIYTCYPFDYIGAAKDRYFVYGELVSGRQVERTA